MSAPELTPSEQQSFAALLVPPFPRLLPLAVTWRRGRSRLDDVYVRRGDQPGRRSGLTMLSSSAVLVRVVTFG
jgi:hypothetical protein